MKSVSIDEHKSYTYAGRLGKQSCGGSGASSDFRLLLQGNDSERERRRKELELSEKDDLWRWATSLPAAVENVPDWVPRVLSWRESRERTWRSYVGALIERLDTALRVSAPKVFDGLGLPAKNERIADLESRLDVSLPETLKDLYRWHDGLRPRQKADGSVWLDTGFFFGCSFASLEDVQEKHELTTRMMADGTYAATDRVGAGWWDAKWIPFLQNDEGGSYCVDTRGTFTGRPGHVLEEWHDDPSRKIEYFDVDAWLETFVGALELGIVGYVEEYGSIQAADVCGAGYERWREYHCRHNLGFPMRFAATWAWQ